MPAETPLTITEAKEKMERGELSAVELTKHSLENIQQWQPHTNAFLEVLEEEALTQAEEQDKLIKEGKGGALAGIPVAVKDLICTLEGHTTAASKILKEFRAPYQATVVERIKAAGAVIIGKTNLDEFAMGGSNEYSAYGVVKNPWDLERVPGGSSGGSAVSVATGGALAAFGTDTGGSVRFPANFCNVVGLKPTYGRVSRFGAIAYASSFDQIGPFARTVQDAALFFETFAGQDPRDATSSPNPVGKYIAACNKNIKDMTIGIPKEFFGEEIKPEVKEVVQAAIEELKKLGAKTKEISLSLMHAAVPTYYLLVKSEASSNLARFDGLRYGRLELTTASLLERYVEARGNHFGPEVKRSILMGTYALSAGYVDAWYKQASRVRTLIRRQFEDNFKDVDVIAGPVSPELPFKIGEKADDPLAMYLADLLTVTASVAGLPAMSVPAGFASEASAPRSSKSEVGLPVGMQLIAPHFEEERLFQVGSAYEQTQDWWKRTPGLTQ